MKHIDIYITHNIRGFQTRDGMYGYTLAYTMKNGDLETREAYEAVGETTQNSIILTAMEKALERVKEAAEITIYQDSKYIANMFASNTVERWRQNGFLNAKGEKIVDFTKWEKVSQLCERHLIKVEYYVHHEFTDYMTNEIGKRTGGVRNEAG